MSLLAPEQAWVRIAERAHALPPCAMPLSRAVGRILSEPVATRIDLPPFDRSAMDGYALRAADTPGRLEVTGEIAAGSMPHGPVWAGTAQRIFTGGPLPKGADAVVRQEDTERDGDTVDVRVRARPGGHVRARGEDAPGGGPLLDAGDAVTVNALHVLASAGLATVPVHRPARVGVLLTGDELVAPGKHLPPGRIYETSGVTLRAMVERAGAEAIDLGTAPDTRARIANRLQIALADVDVLLVAGGVSVGDHDHVKGALADAGVEELFWGVRIKPGKPLFCGHRGEKWAFGLPGNPLSGVVSFLAFVEPLLRRLHGEAGAVERRLPARTTARVEPSDGRRTYLTARLETDAKGVLRATPTAAQGSAMTLALARADGFIVVPDGTPAVRAGGAVDVLRL